MARPNFIELPTRDLSASQIFFERVFGMNMTGFGPSYACTLTGDVDIGRRIERPASRAHHVGAEKFALESRRIHGGTAGPHQFGGQRFGQFDDGRATCGNRG